MTTFQSFDDIAPWFEGNLETEPTKKQYIFKIRDYFIPYLKDKYGELKNDSIIQTLKYEISREDLKKSILWYVSKNESVSSVQALDDFMIAVKRLFLILHKNNIESNLIEIFGVDKGSSISIKKLIEEVKKEAIKIKPLTNREENPSITDDEYQFILKNCNNIINHAFETNKMNFKALASALMIKLILFSGLRPIKIYNLDTNSFDCEMKILKVISTNIEDTSAGNTNSISDNFFYVHLPNHLGIKLKQYVENRQKYIECKNPDDFLFVKSNGAHISDNGYPTDLLKDTLRPDYLKAISNNEDLVLKTELEKNHFTPTGLAKYSIKQMIKKGINQSIIQDFTGWDEIVFRSCQEEVNRELIGNRSRYLDSKLRSIDIFDDL